MDLGTSSKRIKVSFIQICFRSLLSLKKFPVRIINASVKHCSLEQSGAQFNEFAG